jgi:hypothetical protein
MAEDARFRGDFTELAVDPLADPESTRDSIEAQHYLTPRYATAQPKPPLTHLLRRRKDLTISEVGSGQIFMARSRLGALAF